jgi:hypothetical protein
VDTGLAISSVHTYKVRAVDAAGNRSAASTTLSASTRGLGFGSGGTLAGVVFNAGGNVIQNAVARINGTTKTARSDRNGVWTQSGLNPGAYTVTITYAGGLTQTVAMTVIAKHTVVAAVTLS